MPPDLRLLLPRLRLHASSLSPLFCVAMVSVDGLDDNVLTTR